MIAALYVERGGVYYGLNEVDPWDEERDARKYVGPWPVVAHPPCARWSRPSGMVQTRFGYRVGDDGGCFEAALNAVRTYGGVLEHPAYSKAWRHFGLPYPHRAGGWSCMIGDDGWSAWVDQGWYGHALKKPTWLYAIGVDLERLAWGRGPGRYLPHRDPTMSATQRRRLVIPTPVAFRDLLIGLAKSASGSEPPRVRGEAVDVNGLAALGAPQHPPP